MARILALSALALLLSSPALGQSPGVLLTIQEAELGEWNFPADGSATVTVPAGSLLQFSWFAEVESGQGTILGYRYGWDVVDANDPFDPGWAYEGLAPVESSPPMSFQQGVHTLSVLAESDTGVRTIGIIRLEIDQDVPDSRRSVGQVKARHAPRG